MPSLPSTERILLGPGPSMIAPRVLRAMGAPMLSHLDPDFIGLMDDVRARLNGLFRADAEAFTIAVSVTGTSAIETPVANGVGEGTRAVPVTSTASDCTLSSSVIAAGAVNRYATAVPARSASRARSGV